MPKPSSARWSLTYEIEEQDYEPSDDLDDLEWFDKQLPSFILHTPPGLDFEDYSSFIVGDLLHEFIIELKGDEIETEEDPDYGVIYNEKSRNKVMEMYWDLKPILEKRYKDRLYQSWEKRR